MVGASNKKLWQKRIILLAVVIGIFIVENIITGGKMLTGSNIRTILMHAVFPAFAAWGMMFIFTTGLIDLSVGAQVLLGANIGAIIAVDAGLGYVGLILGTIVVVIICEQIVVFCNQNLRIPGWIAGLGCGLVFEAILVMYATKRSETSGSSVLTLPDSLRVLGRWPAMVIIWVVAAVIAYIVFNRTSIGLNLRAVGGNESVASAMGINRKKTIILAALVGSLFLAVGAILDISYAGKLSPSSGLGSISLIFKGLATVLLAQSFTSIVSDAIGIFVGAIFVQGLFNFLTIMGVPSGTGQEIFLGAVVIICGILARLNFKGVAK